MEEKRAHCVYSRNFNPSDCQDPLEPSVDPYKVTVKQPVRSRSSGETLEAGKALEDLDFIVERVRERHPAAVNGLLDELNNAWQGERAALAGLPEVTVLELWQSSARALTALGDGHTGSSHSGGTRPGDSGELSIFRAAAGGIS